MSPTLSHAVLELLGRQLQGLKRVHAGYEPFGKTATQAESVAF